MCKPLFASWWNEAPLPHLTGNPSTASSWTNSWTMDAVSYTHTLALENGLHQCVAMFQRRLSLIRIMTVHQQHSYRNTITDFGPCAMHIMRKSQGLWPRHHSDKHQAYVLYRRRGGKPPVTYHVGQALHTGSFSFFRNKMLND